MLLFHVPCMSTSPSARSVSIAQAHGSWPLLRRLPAKAFSLDTIVSDEDRFQLQIRAVVQKTIKRRLPNSLRRILLAYSHYRSGDTPGKSQNSWRPSMKLSQRGGGSGVYP